MAGSVDASQMSEETSGISGRVVGNERPARGSPRLDFMTNDIHISCEGNLKS